MCGPQFSNQLLPPPSTLVNHAWMLRHTALNSPINSRPLPWLTPLNHYPSTIGKMLWHSSIHTPTWRCRMSYSGKKNTTQAHHLFSMSLSPEIQMKGMVMIAKPSFHLYLGNLSTHQLLLICKVTCSQHHSHQRYRWKWWWQWPNHCFAST